MCSTAVKRLVTIIMICAISAPLRAEAPPRVLQDPLLGLRYEPAKVHFEPVTHELISRCSKIAGDEQSHGIWFVFAKAGDATGRTFYLLNGYEIRSRPMPGSPRYTAGGFGLLVMSRGAECEIVDADARQSFDDRLFNDELPQDILQRLAMDFAARLQKAYGGKERLRVEIANQHVDLEALPEELKVSLQDLRAK